jgi:hypothetical protein
VLCLALVLSLTLFAIDSFQTLTMLSDKAPAPEYGTYQYSALSDSMGIGACFFPPLLRTPRAARRTAAVFPLAGSKWSGGTSKQPRVRCCSVGLCSTDLDAVPIWMSSYRQHLVL